MAGQNEDKSASRPPDPDAVVKALEVELMLKRAAWHKHESRRGTWRALSFLFLLLVILGALFAYFYLAPKLAHRADQPESAESSGY